MSKKETQNQEYVEIADRPTTVFKTYKGTFVDITVSSNGKVEFQISETADSAKLTKEETILENTGKKTRTRTVRHSFVERITIELPENEDESVSSRIAEAHIFFDNKYYEIAKNGGWEVENTENSLLYVNEFFLLIPGSVDEVFNSSKTKRAPNAPTPRNEAEGMKNFTKEMISALGTALIFIAFVIQAFTIPTGSMESSLLRGDFLLGVKLMYGTNIIPKTSNLPILNRLPFPDTYWKIPGFTSPKAGDVIIFEYPGFPYPAHSPKKRYIKRCVAVAGDTVEIFDKDLFVNGVRQTLPPKGQFIATPDKLMRMYGSKERPHFKPLYVPKAGDTLHFQDLDIREFHFYKNLIRQENPHSNVEQQISFTLNGKDASQRELTIYYHKFRNQWFPYVFNTLIGELDTANYWTDYQFHFDKIRTAKHLAKHNPEITWSLTMDGKKVEQYVVKQDNYFMMGDNRDNSADSRYWGFLNRNFIEAQALIVYFSFDNIDGKFKFTNPTTWWRIPGRIRYNRMGKLIRPWEGTPDEIESNRKEILYPVAPVETPVDSVTTELSADSL